MKIFFGKETATPSNPDGIVVFLFSPFLIDEILVKIALYNPVFDSCEEQKARKPLQIGRSELFFIS